jgi:Ca2+/H+ antiporter
MTNRFDTPDWEDEDDVSESPERFWTTRRIVLLIIALILILSLLAEYVAPIVETFSQPTPLPLFNPDAPRV